MKHVISMRHFDLKIEVDFVGPQMEQEEFRIAVVHNGEAIAEALGGEYLYTEDE